MRKAALHNLGCKVNAYETEAMEQLLEAAGYEIVGFEEKADVYVINTCSVTNVADNKSRQMLHRAKAKNPDAVVVAAGCYVQAAADKLREDAAVDLIIGNNRKADLVPLLDAWFAGKEIKESSIFYIGLFFQKMITTFCMCSPVRSSINNLSHIVEQTADNQLYSFICHLSFSLPSLHLPFLEMI